MELKQGTSRWQKLWSATKTSPCNLGVPNSDDPRKWWRGNIYQMIRSKMDFENIAKVKSSWESDDWRSKSENSPLPLSLSSYLALPLLTSYLLLFLPRLCLPLFTWEVFPNWPPTDTSGTTIDKHLLMVCRATKNLYCLIIVFQL